MRDRGGRMAIFVLYQILFILHSKSSNFEFFKVALGLEHKDKQHQSLSFSANQVSRQGLCLWCKHHFKFEAVGDVRTITCILLKRQIVLLLQFGGNISAHDQAYLRQ